MDPIGHNCIIEAFDSYLKDQGMCVFLLCFRLFLRIYRFIRSVPSGARYIYEFKQWYISTGVWKYYNDISFEKVTDNFEADDRIVFIALRFVTVRIILS